MVNSLSHYHHVWFLTSTTTHVLYHPAWELAAAPTTATKCLWVALQLLLKFYHTSLIATILSKKKVMLNWIRLLLRLGSCREKAAL